MQRSWEEMEHKLKHECEESKDEFRSWLDG